MKLYYSPGACSLAVRIVAAEAGIALETEIVDLATKQAASGRDYFQINPKGLVPALILDDGALLTEGPVIMQFLADSKPANGLAPAFGTMDRYRLLEVLGFLNAEIHKGFSPMFHPMADDARIERRTLVQKKYEILDALLQDREWLVGDRFTVADAYMFTLTNWAAVLDVDLSVYKNVQAFQGRVAKRAHVLEALGAEGLLKAA